MTNRKKVTQRLSLKAIQPNSGAPGQGVQKIQLPGVRQPSVFEPATPVPQQIQGHVYVPFSIILQAIPAQYLTAPLAELLAHPESGVEVGLPLALILPALPSGKVEFTVQEIVPYIPEGFVQPAEVLGDEALASFTLPLYQIASRIPADSMILRGDQRPVDSSVLSMADPFSPEMLGLNRPEPEPEAAATDFAPAPETPVELEPEPVAADPISQEPELMNVPEIVPEPVTAPALEIVPEPSVPPPALVEPAASVEPESELQYDPAILAAAEAELEREALGAAEPAPEPSIEEIAASVEPPQEEVYDSGPTPATQEAPATAVAPTTGEIDWANALAELNAQAEQEAAVRVQPEEAPAIPSPSLEPPVPAFDLSGKTLQFPVRVEETGISGIEGREATIPPPKGTLAGKLPPLESALSMPTRPVPVPFLNEPAKSQGQGFVKVMQPRLWEAESAPPVPEGKMTPALPIFPAIPQPAHSASSSIKKEASRTQRLHFISLSPTVNNLLGVPLHEDIKLKDVVGQIRRWPGVLGCIIAGKDGLPITSETEDRGFAQSLSAFAPKILARVNELFTDLGMAEAEEVHVPAGGASTFIYRYDDVYFILLHREANVPPWYSKIIRQVLKEIATSKKTV
ncbi:MAG: hypothetical protein PHD76_08510 [Methylacidiphilales bacterium]|nr:hypothetical protein [Candidatus Methylacidiphilales bacterium]